MALPQPSNQLHSSERTGNLIRTAWSALTIAALCACSGLGAGPPQDTDGTSSGDGDGDTGTSSTTTTTDGTTTDTSGDGDGGGSPVVPARIRRLTNLEYNASVQALIGTALSPGDDFPPDTRQQGFTLNEAQRVDPVLARQLDAAAVTLADEVVAKLDQFAPCPDQRHAECAAEFVDTFGEKAYRRPLTTEDRGALLGLFDKGFAGGTYEEGIHLIVRGLLQSPGFLYLTEIGDGSDGGNVRMTAHEIAASLAYLLTGEPPDDVMLNAAESGELDSADGRAAQARRLLSAASGQSRGLRIVREWLGLDRILATSKDAMVYQDFDGLRASMNQETDDFVNEVLKTSGGDVGVLLGAPWTIANENLAQMYGATGSGRIQVPDRPGLLNRAAFLSVYAHAHETSPIMRGTAVLRRVVCHHIELPTDLSVEIIPPVPDPSKSTRERFAIHSEDVSCSKCHKLIDPLGFSFEQFDGMGKLRREVGGKLMENDSVVDTSAEVSINYDFDGAYASSTDLSAAVAASQDVRECFARQIFRASVGEASGVERAEQIFVDSWSELEGDDQRSLIEILVHLATSDVAVQRSAP